MTGRIDGASYTVTDSEKRHFVERGNVHLRGLLTEEEVTGLAASVAAQLC